MKRAFQFDDTDSHMCNQSENTLEERFSYLIQSSVCLAVPALDQRIKLSFSDNFTPGKRFIFYFNVVKKKLKELLPAQVYRQGPVSITTTANPAKKPIGC